VTNIAVNVRNAADELTVASRYQKTLEIACAAYCLFLLLLVW